MSFKGAHFPKEVILMGVRWYVAYPLSTRHVEGEHGDAGGNRKSPVEWRVPFACHSNPEKPFYACQTATRHL